jgi:hypothetical protein
LNIKGRIAATIKGRNSRNGHRAKTVLTEVGPVEISVPRDRDSSFEPTIIAKWQQRLTGVEDRRRTMSRRHGTMVPGVTMSLSTTSATPLTSSHLHVQDTRRRSQQRDSAPQSSPALRQR